MLLLDFVRPYCRERELSASSHARFRYELAIWSRHGGPLFFRNVTTAVVAEWRRTAKIGGLSPRTIESVISTVSALLKFGGTPIEIGRRLRFAPQPPDVPTLAELDRVIAISPPWHLAWLAIAYNTGLRLGDLERQQLTCPDAVEIVAAKTGKRQVIPIADPVRRLLTGQNLRRPRRKLRRELSELCEAAGIRRIGPQQIRALSATEWERARPGAGAVILGHSLPGWSTATRYYLDPGQQLRLALPSFRLPSFRLPSFRLPQSLLTAAERIAAATAETELVAMYRAMPSGDRETAVSVLRAMSR